MSRKFQIILYSVLILGVLILFKVTDEKRQISRNGETVEILVMKFPDCAYEGKYDTKPYIRFSLEGETFNKSIKSKYCRLLHRDYFSEKVYLTVIPRNVRLSEAPSHGMPVLIYDKTCPGSKSYFSFTDEFLNQESTIGSAA